MHKKIKRVYQFLLTLLSIICLTIACEMMITKTFLLSPTHWVKTSQESQYTNYLTNSINQSIQDIGAASGIKNDGLKNVISEEQVQENLNQFITSAFQGKAYEVTDEKIKESLYRTVEEYAKQENMIINESNQVYVDNLVNQGVQLYNSQINNKVISTIGLRVHLIQRMVRLLLLITSGMFVLLLILLYFASDRYKHVFVRNIAYIVMTTGLLLVTITILIKIKNPVGTISLLDPGMKLWVNTSLKLPMNAQSMISGAFVILGLLLSIYSYLEYKRLEKRGFRRKKHRTDQLEEFELDEDVDPILK